MYRNIPVIVVVNTLLTLANIYLLTTPWIVQDDTATLRRTQELKELLDQLDDLVSHNESKSLVNKSQDRSEGRLIPHMIDNIRNKSNWSDSAQRHVKVNRPPNIPSYHSVFNDLSVQKKSRSVDWPSLQQIYTVPSIGRTKLADCQAILLGDTKEIFRVKELIKQREYTKEPIYEETYLRWTEDCQAFKTDRGYIKVPLSKEEEAFPIAFSISMYTDVEQVERLLRAVYQPQNLYCIHVDTKSSLLIHQTVRSLVSCFDNVFITSRLEKVKWGDVSVLLPHLNCMRDLVKHYRGKWKYFIDLAGQEFPLRTNYEIVQILKIFNGSNDLTASHKRMEQDRIRFQWNYRWSRTYQQTIFFNTFRLKEPPPYNLTVLKGEIHGLFSRFFVEFIVENYKAKSFLKWCWNTGHASEHYWNTLNFNNNIEAPGGYYGNLEEIEQYSLEPATRAKHWQDVNYILRGECQGKLVRGICVFGLGDLPWLARRKEIIANKFHLTFEYVTLDCLEERHRNRTAMHIGRVSPDFDYAYYNNLPTVKHSRKNGL